MPPSQSTSRVTPAPLVLVCLDACHGEFHLPLGWDEKPVCPNDPRHDVAVYGNVVVRRYCNACGDELGLWQAGRELCATCEQEIREENRDLEDWDV